MEIQQFEHLESKIISLIELVRQKKNENSMLLKQVKELKTERELIQEKTMALLERIKHLETELK